MASFMSGSAVTEEELKKLLSLSKRFEKLDPSDKVGQAEKSRAKKEIADKLTITDALRARSGGAITQDEFKRLKDFMRGK